MATNEQIAEMLSEGTGTSISAGTLDPTKTSKKLSWEDITERFAEGEAIGQGEFLPTIPTAGMTDSSGNPITASTFYRESNISPTIFSQTPFSTFESTVANPVQQNSYEPSPEARSNSDAVGRTIKPKEDHWTSLDIEQLEMEGKYLSLGPTIPGKITLGMPSTMIGQLFGGIAGVMSGKHDLNFALPSLGSPDNNDTFLQGLASYHGLSSRAMEVMSTYQMLGFGDMYNYSDEDNIQPGKSDTGKPDTIDWDAWESGSVWGSTYNLGAFTDESAINNTTPSNYDPTGGDGGISTGGGDNNTYNDQDGLVNTTPSDYDESGDGSGGPSSEDDIDAMVDDFSEGYQSGGRVGMQEGGEAPQMPMPQPQGGEAEMANLGMINEQAAAPQNGGQQSIKDDVPREADAGDYILPYETVLMVGLKQLNRYAKEAIELAMKNGINLKGTDLDPTDDVPIKVSNYEYHIPKALVPYYGGGKKYLDKIRDEGLALRKRLEEEKQPSVQEQQPMQPPQPQAAPAPPPQMMAEAPAAAPAPTPMMAEGGFVLGQQEDKQSVEQSLTADTSQPTQSAYNQVQAIERSRIQKQQPPMVDPTGRVVQQGFAAPQGYRDGDMVEDPELEKASEPKAQPPLPDWANRALDPKTPILVDEDGNQESVKTASVEVDGKHHLFPTIRMAGDKLKKYDSIQDAYAESLKKKDFIVFDTEEEATTYSEYLSDTIGRVRQAQMGDTNNNNNGFATPPMKAA